MKVLIVSALLATAALADRDYDAMFREFKAKHLKSYASEVEDSLRFKAFVSNMRRAEVLAKANPLATFGDSPFADMTPEEFKSRLNGKAFVDAQKKNPMKTPKIIPSLAERKAAAGIKVDWREKGVITPVKNQGSCGSCWAFSVTGNIESQWAIAGNPLTTVSEQELVACDYVPGSNEGCNGGWMNTAMQWIVEKRNGEIVTEASYPYASGGGRSPACVSNLDSLPVGAKIDSYSELEITEEAMAAFVATSGTLSIALDATSFQTYRSGIVTNCISRQVNHAVLAVGYDDTNVPPYWIIKNSWGTSWGESGYIRVAKGSNQCQLNEYPVTAIVAPKTPSLRGNGTSVVQTSCTDKDCSEGCNSDVFPTGSCLLTDIGTSISLECSKETMYFTEFFTNNCTGVPLPYTIPAANCIPDFFAGSYNYACGFDAAAPAPAAVFRKKH